MSNIFAEMITSVISGHNKKLMLLLFTIRRKRDNFHIGCYAAEYEGHATAETAKTILRSDLDRIFNRRFDENEYEIFEEDYIIEEGEVTQSFGRFWHQSTWSPSSYQHIAAEGL